MGAIASQITSFTIVYSIVYSDADERKHQSSVSLAFVRGIHRGQMTSNAENVSIWWRHHVEWQFPWTSWWLSRGFHTNFQACNLASFIDRSSNIPDSKVHGTNMGPTWVLSAPNGPHVGPMNLSWDQHGAHLGPVGPRWAPCRPHEPCYLGFYRRQEANPPPQDLRKCIQPGKVANAVNGVFVTHCVGRRVSVHLSSKALRCAFLKHSVNNHYAFGNSCKNPK